MAESSSWQNKIQNVKYDYEEMVMLARRVLLGIGAFEELLLFFAFAKIGFFEWLLLTLIAAFSIVISYVRYSRRLDGRYDLRVLLGISKDGKSVKMPQDYADFAGMLFCPFVAGVILFLFNHLENGLFNLSTIVHMLTSGAGLGMEFYEIFVLNQ
ncbi:hypothetical protein WR25_23953 [Diploscapter pachys]|uniref:DUF7087 domain-containing protein n=1 Tax=Diploscapter pachys TaxID=2018661 RepID=A0A2A2LAH4_9BILA|nr:hypothetical protein WR25_23953 [Diploscapter pachys]